MEWLNEQLVKFHATPAEMDELWSRGWRHFGITFFRYNSMVFEGEWLHIIPLRLDLSAFKVTKSQKRILKRNRRMKIVIRDAFVDEGKHRLFEIHKKRFASNVPDSLYTFLSDQPATIPCNTKEICLFDQGKLVGVSFLDIGDRATSSVYAMFDPDKLKHSLGIYLILVSIQHSLGLGKTFYYPGYGTREYSHYDYKKRFIGLEYYNYRNWKRLQDLSD